MTENMYYVLLALRSPIYVEDILSEILSLSHGRVKMGPGTLFTLLTKAEKQKFIIIQTGKDSQRKAYRISAEGLEALKKEYALLKEMIEDGSEYAARWPQ